MNTILFHSNILSKQDIPFLNEVYNHLNENGYTLLLTGWNPVLPDWDLKADYFKIPESLDCFKNIYSRKKIEEDFKKYDLSTTFLLDRFNWWFAEPKSNNEKLKRLNFLHFHLHHYLKLIKENNPSLLLIWNGNDPRQYIISKLGENFGIERLFLERGPLPSVIFYDQKGVLNNSSVSSFDFNKLQKTFDTHSHFKDYSDWYNNTSETLWDQPLNSENIDLREKFGISKNQKIIVFFGQVDNDIQNKLFSPYFNSNIKAFDWFIQNAITDEYFVIGKHHPKCEVSVEKYQSLIRNNTQVVWTDQLSLKQCLDIADYVVAVNSSVIFDALLYKKPVYALGQSLLSNKDILYEYSPDTYKQTLKLFYDSSAFENKLLNFQNMVELLFRENLIFTKNESSSKEFSRKILSLTADHNNQDNSFENKKIIENYYGNISIKEDSNSYGTLKKKIKNIYRMLLFKNFRRKIGRIKKLLASIEKLENLEKEREKGIKTCFGLTMHYTALINVDKPELIKTGTNCYVGPYAVIYVNNYNASCNNSFLELGDETSIGEFSNIRACGGKIKIGSKVQIAQNVNIIASNHMFEIGTPIKEQPWSEKNNFIEIGNDVWIGCGTTILPGAKIGSGSIIGANSLVTGEIPENVIAYGSPAKVIKSRDDI